MEYDYIIAGGGSAGCVLAARLSEDPGVTVCLIEAGGRGDSLLVRAPAMVAAMVSGRPKINNWAFHTVPQPGLNGRKGFQPRGKTLGGSSAINAMLYLRGHPADYDEWADLGADGWDWQSVRPWFLHAEGNSRPGPHHAGTGPLQVADQSAPRPVSRAFLAAATECQHPQTPDFNGDTQAGTGLYQVTQYHCGPRRGQRCSAAAAYLHPVMQRPNLTVMLHTKAERISLDGTRATGLLVRRGRRRIALTARRETILSLGSLKSPQLLLLSGIGPDHALRPHGIPVLHALEGVGHNLQDHLDYTVSHHALIPDVVGLNPAGLLRLARAGLHWRTSGTGLFASPMAEAGGFLKTDPALHRPDIQLHFVIGIVDDHLRKLHTADGYSCHVCVLRPQSRGTVSLHSADPAAPPAIDPGFLSHPADLHTLRLGARQMDAILQSPALAPWRGKRLYPHDGSDAALDADIRARADTIYHPVGTCRMGTDPLAVTDPQLRVHGLQSLRVIDASVMPRLIGGNTNAATMMLAERAAHLIRTAAL